MVIYSRARPHFGGLWEAAVKSFKAHLRRVVGENQTDFRGAHDRIGPNRSMYQLSTIDALTGGLKRTRCINTRTFLDWKAYYIITRFAGFLSAYISPARVEPVSDTYSTLLAPLVIRILMYSCEILQRACTYTRSHSWRYRLRQRRAYGTNEMGSCSYRSDPLGTRQEG